MTPEGSPSHILIIDDEASIREMLKLYLEHHGYIVTTAADGDEGIRILKKIRPDLIVLDIGMPKKDGFDVYKEICAGHEQARFPVLVMTGRGGYEEVFESIGADGFIQKPFEMNVFIEKIRSILKKDRTHPVVFIADLPSSPHAQKIAETLRNSGYTALWLDDFDVLREFVRKPIPGCVLAEYMQEDLDGASFLREVAAIISARPPENRIPLFVYTYSGFDCEKKSLEAGASKFLGAPKDPGEAVRALEDYALKHPRPPVK